MGKVTDRQDKLIDYLEKQGKLSVADIAAFFDISLPTARRMCAQLEKKQRIMRTHGGIRFVPPVETPYAFDAIDGEFSSEKTAIAENASALVNDNQIIFLESGTTVKQFAIALAARIREGQLSKIAVYTNSLVNLEILEPACKVTLVGGVYRPERRDFCGFLSEKLLRTLRFDACFIGADGLNLSDGIMAMDIETVRIDELLIERSASSYILVHSEKFSKHSFISYCAVQEVSAIITDSKLSQETVKEYHAAGVHLVCV
jgi:DeoR/GlpR family transcriptional regulator of sugar metabolism